MICHTSLSHRFLPRHTPTPYRRVVVWQCPCLTCQTFASPKCGKCSNHQLEDGAALNFEVSSDCATKTLPRCKKCGGPHG